MLLRTMTLAGLFWSSAAFAQINTIERIISAFENICVASRFSEDATQALVQAASRSWGVTVRQMPNEFLVISPGTRRSWGLIGRDNEALIVQVGERLADGKRSRNCSITAVNADFGRLRTSLERQFQLRKLGDVKQGSNDVTIYNATLIGYPDVVGVGLQLMRDPQRPETFLTLSMFEVAGF